jgi:hypothetical protein
MQNESIITTGPEHGSNDIILVGIKLFSVLHHLSLTRKGS